MTDQLIATRLLRARPPVVWRALTTPKYLALFWGGHHATVPEESVNVDLRVGGSFALTTVGPTGHRHRLVFAYTEISEPRRLAFTEPETGITTLRRTGSTPTGAMDAAWALPGRRRPGSRAAEGQSVMLADASAAS